MRRKPFRQCHETGVYIAPLSREYIQTKLRGVDRTSGENCKPPQRVREVPRSRQAVSIARVLSRTREGAAHERHEQTREDQPLPAQVTTFQVTEFMCDDHVTCSTILS